LKYTLWCIFFNVFRIQTRDVALKFIYEGTEGLTKDNFGFFKCLAEDMKLIAILTVIVNYIVDPVVWPKRLG